MIAVIALIILSSAAQRRIPVQYAKRVVGRRMYGGQNTHMPLRVNTAGVIPIIFASRSCSCRAHRADSSSRTGRRAASALRATCSTTSSTGSLIIFFTLLLHGGRLQPERPGGQHAEVRRLHPGHPAREEDRRLHRQGAVAHHVGARSTWRSSRCCRTSSTAALKVQGVPGIGPWLDERCAFLTQGFGFNFYFGGTALLIVVGVALDTVQQIESHLLMRHYEGFMKAAASGGGGASVMRLVLLGPPGVGKGTQAELLAGACGSPRSRRGRSCGAAVRARHAARARGPGDHGAGRLVPDDLMIGTDPRAHRGSRTCGTDSSWTASRARSQQGRTPSRQMLAACRARACDEPSRQLRRARSGPACERMLRRARGRRGARADDRSGDRSASACGSTGEKTEPLAASTRERGLLAALDGRRLDRARSRHASTRRWRRRGRRSAA